jgi:ATP-dependent Lon protease
MKIHIASNYLIPSICQDIGIPVNSIEISFDIIENIINNYTNEGGVRKLKEKLYKIYRELNHANLTKNKILDNNINFPLTLTNKLYEHLFKNIPKYIHLTVHKHNGVGMVNGLWANSLGQGGVLPIESVLIPSKHIMSVKATGSLGDVIKESIEVALSVAWNKLDNDLKLEWMTKWKSTPECFHIHCPDGSTGKEGPSAGAAMTLTFYSRLTNRKIKHTVAMTGEINLREEVTEIGGLDEKLNAAKRAGATLALVPFNNRIDLENVIKNNTSLIDDNFKVLLVENIDQVIEHALL